jgi:hypothetical protein
VQAAIQDIYHRNCGMSQLMQESKCVNEAIRNTAGLDTDEDCKKITEISGRYNPA